jgi:DNA modification methylase
MASGLSNKLIGQVGEFLVCAELGRRGFVATPFAGTGTTCVAAKALGRRWLGIELNPEYVELARKRLLDVDMQPQRMKPAFQRKTRAL